MPPRVTHPQPPRCVCPYASCSYDADQRVCDECHARVKADLEAAAIAEAEQAARNAPQPVGGEYDASETVQAGVREATPRRRRIFADRTPKWGRVWKDLNLQR
eukprot:m.102809 g.102809  ORF g.102809 m.102809 type:complete len:103 (-) comp10449_c2_seq1:57-365(-)